MRHIRSHVLHGLIGGLAGGIVVASWFLVVDLIAGQLFRTPVLLARALFDLDAGDGVAAIAGPTLALEYTVIHFTVLLPPIAALLALRLPE